MKSLICIFPPPGNTEKVAQRLTATVQKLGHQIDTINVIGDRELDVLSYDVIFVGSGVYQWLPGKPMQEFISGRLSHYAAAGEIKYASPRRAQKKVIVYCTFGGAHTGANKGHSRSQISGPVV